MKNNYFIKLGLLLYLLGGFSLINGWAQTQNWYFGDRAGIRFANGGITALTNSAMLTYEGCTVLSDDNGQLLAYSNGEVVWDSQHQPMPNGSSGLGGNNSTSQGALLLPMPGDVSGRAYLFCLDAIENNLVGGLRYSVLDFRLRGGLGDVTATKGVVLPTPVVGGKLTEKLTAVRHANGRDYWIVVHGWQSNAFYSFLLSPTGVSTVPVVSNVGPIHQGGGSFFGAGNAVGCMRASPNGRRLALAQRDSQCELYDFDNATGSVSNYLLLASHDYTYGVEFSADNTKLYTTYSLAGQITQYNLLAGSPTAIVNSATVIVSAERLGNLLLGPDNKIYVASYGNTFLNVIQNPNAVGAACDYRRRAVDLGGRQGLNGLPNFASSYASPYSAAFTFTPGCAGAPTAFVGVVQPPASGVVVSWNFGDPTSGSANTATGLTPTHTYATAGTYQVTMTAVVPGVAIPVVATQTVTIPPLPQVSLGNDVVVCASQFLLSAGSQPVGSTYQWQDGSTGDSYTVRASGRYSVTVTSSAGCTSTAAVNVTLNTLPAVRLPADTLVCANSVLLRPRVQPAGSTYRWQDGSTGATYLAQASGRYSVTVTSPAGCASTAAVNVTLSNAPVVRLPADTTACGASVLLRPRVQPAGSTYRWQDGSTSATYLAQANGRYSVTVTSPAGCPSTAAVNVTLSAPSTVRLPTDTLVCASSVLLRPRVQPTGSTYRWQDGSTGATCLAQASGRYSVTVTSPAGCATAAAVNVVLGSVPAIRLPADTTSCSASVVLRPSGQPAGSTYRWQDGSTSATYLAQASGRYSVTVTSPIGCTSTAAVNVTLNAAPLVRLPTDTLACTASVLLRPGMQPAGSTYRWQDGSTSATYLARASGRYSVTVTTAQGCSGTAAVNVVLGTVPSVRLPADTASCTASLLLQVRAQPVGSTYRWQDGSTSATYSAKASGRYSVTVTSPTGCASTATVNVTLNAVPLPRLPLDTLVCATSVLLRPGAQPVGSTYRWQDGSTGATYLAQSTGTYTVLVTTPQGCTGTATSQVRLGIKPSVSLGADTAICPNATLVLRTNPQPAGTLYRWQDGSTAATYLASGPGQYSVEVRATATSCPTSATRIITAVNCPIIIPNIITPNGDQENEFFTLKGLVAAEWHLIIFDRWGRQVYDRAHYDNGWNAAGQASGMYYYLLSNEATGARYRGWVEVVRGN